MTKMTRDKQVMEVVQGLALGTLHAGTSEVTSSKLDLEFAIGRALRSWSGAGRYPGLADFIQGPNYVYLGFGKSARRGGVVHAAWERAGKVWVPYLTMPHFAVEESLEMFAQFAAVDSISGWRDLGVKFVEHLDTIEKRRSGSAEVL